MRNDIQFFLNTADPTSRFQADGAFDGPYELARTVDGAAVTFTSHAPTVADAVEIAFDFGNGMAIGADGSRWPHHLRSLSVGDIIKVTPGDTEPQYLAIAPTGFTEATAPDPAL